MRNEKTILILATTNSGKIREITPMLSDIPLIICSLTQLSGKPEPFTETGKTFEENAVAKAVYYSKFSDELVLAEDSGIEVDALDGRPGIYSARYAGKNATDEQNNLKLLRELESAPSEKRNCRYHTVCALAKHGKIFKITSGSVNGKVSLKPAGRGGFGYDPIFFVPEYNKTMAELGSEVKNSISHRYHAVKLMNTKLKKLLASEI